MIYLLLLLFIEICLGESFHSYVILPKRLLDWPQHQASKGKPVRKHKQASFLLDPGRKKNGEADLE